MTTELTGGETDLALLLSQMQPELHDGEYVFTTLRPEDLRIAMSAVGWFREQEGATLILPREDADILELPYTFVAGWITLRVHSSLAAVGLSAAVTRILAEAGFSANLVAAYYHDHLFVPIGDAARALACLRALSAGSS